VIKVKKIAGVLLLLVLLANSCKAGKWYPGIIHCHSTCSDGGHTPSELAGVIRTELASLRSDSKCFMIVTDHFDGIARDFGGYTGNIRGTSVGGSFVAIPGLELGSKWHPEENTVASSHLLAIGHLPVSYPSLVNCYYPNTDRSGFPLSEKFDTQQQLINGVLALGMLPIAAHPSQLIYGGSTVRFDNRFNMKSGFSGLRGVEMFNTLGPGQDDECINFYLRLIGSGAPVIITSGSDYHGTTASTIPDAILGSLDRITWVYAKELTEDSIIEGIVAGHTYASRDRAFFYPFFSDSGQNPGQEIVGVDEMRITAEARITGTNIDLIVYRDGVEVARQNHNGSSEHRSNYALCNNKSGIGWVDHQAKLGEIYRYVVRVVATTNSGRKTLLVTSPITLRLRPKGVTYGFFDAIKFNNLGMIESMLATDPSLVNATDNRGVYQSRVHGSQPLALSVACAMCNTETVRCLLEHGASPDEYISCGEPGPLMEVALNGDTEKARLLLEHGGNVNICTDGNTPLIWAIDQNHSDLAKFLIDNGADINHPGDSGHKPLTVAKKMNMQEIVRILIQKGAEE